jgi:hypothetical protein
MGTTPRRSHAERPPRRCQLCVAPLVSPPLSVMLTADSYPTLRRRDDTTTATENCVCEIRTPEQSRQQGDDAGMEMTTLDTGWTTHGVAWMERLVLRGRRRREHRCAAAGNVGEYSTDPRTHYLRQYSFELEGADVHSAPSRGMSRRCGPHGSAPCRASAARTAVVSGFLAHRRNGRRRTVSAARYRFAPAAFAPNALVEALSHPGRHGEKIACRGKKLLANNSKARKINEPGLAD